MRGSTFQILSDNGSIGYDSYFMDEPSTASKMELNTPENKRPIPCEQGCPKYEACAAAGSVCAAFRNWCSTGNYADRDVARLIRVEGYMKAKTMA
jgi:hypothetical protein